MFYFVILINCILINMNKYNMHLCHCPLLDQCTMDYGQHFLSNIVYCPLSSDDNTVKIDVVERPTTFSYYYGTVTP